MGVSTAADTCAPIRWRLLHGCCVCVCVDLQTIEDLLFPFLQGLDTFEDRCLPTSAWPSSLEPKGFRVWGPESSFLSPVMLRMYLTSSSNTSLRNHTPPSSSLSHKLQNRKYPKQSNPKATEHTLSSKP